MLTLRTRPFSSPELVSITLLRPRIAKRSGGGQNFEEMRVNKFGVGQPVLRVEDPRFITGRGRFVDDFELPQQCHGVVVMSVHAHARIKRIDAARPTPAPRLLAAPTAPD